MSSRLHVNNIQPYEGNTVHFDGNVSASGNILANSLIISSVTESVLFKSGSSRFGNDSGDTHTFTGSIYVSGSIYFDPNTTGSFGYVTASTVSASHYVGGPAELNNITASDNISASGHIYGNLIHSNNLAVVGNTLGSVNVGDGSGATPLKLWGNITSSYNVSASGNLTEVVIQNYLEIRLL